LALFYQLQSNNSDQLKNPKSVSYAVKQKTLKLYQSLPKDQFLGLKQQHSIHTPYLILIYTHQLSL